MRPHKIITLQPQYIQTSQLIEPCQVLEITRTRPWCLCLYIVLSYPPVYIYISINCFVTIALKLVTSVKPYRLTASTAVIVKKADIMHSLHKGTEHSWLPHWWPTVNVLSDYKESVHEFSFPHSHCSHVTDMLVKFRQNDIPLGLLKCKHMCCPSMFTKFSRLFLHPQVTSKQNPKNHYSNYTLQSA